MNLLSTDFPVKPQRNLLIRRDFNWNQFTFNSFESTLIWFSFWTSKKSIRKNFNWNQLIFNSFESTFNWFSFWTSKRSIDKKGFQLNSTYFQLMWIYFQLIFLSNLKKTTPQKVLCTIGCHPNNYIIEDLGHYGVPLSKNCLGAVFR